jgi:beta-glucosidase
LRKLKFKEDFLFGVSTSAYQIEGGNVSSDWYYWEKKKGYEECGISTDFWNRFREDVSIMNELGINIHRMSVEWSRIEPREGETNWKAIERYREILTEHKRKGIKTMLVLHHFTLPYWFSKNNSFLRDENMKYFENYVSLIARELKDYVDYFGTISEPVVWATMGYYLGVYPPGIKSTRLFYKAYKAILKAHSVAYHTVKSEAQNKDVGMIVNYSDVVPIHNRGVDKVLARCVNKFLNDEILNGLLYGKVLGKKIEGLENSIDFLGLNYYTRIYTCIFGSKPYLEGERLTQRGWGVYPDGIKNGIKFYSSLNKPIIITENGIATDDENWRKEFITSHLEKIYDTLVEGYKVNGYLYWSYIDNFEWEMGYGPKFGLVGFDKKSLKRNLKESAYFYSRICKSKEILIN